MLTLVRSPGSAVQLPASSLTGTWACCHLRLLGSGWCELAGVPVGSAEATVARLQSLGASRVSLTSGSALCVVRFQAKRSVVFQLSGAFPSASKVS
ncbi:MAG: hypothetical protein HC851_24820 [Acaryochloris sp. RU_4_1]|nr:hypothetical protein [Acaryochloris sp. SU_5_25]NJM68654.1 hypothetical protein [Acaryochloris sp. RU_4_1]